ncbi:hypothetical protein AAMO2058_000868000 [Amorphochlora amoebiformis]
METKDSGAKETHVVIIEGIRFEEHAELPENDGVNDQKDPAFEEFKLAMENLERFDLVNIIEEIFEKSTKKTEAILRSALDGFGVKAVVKTKVREGEAGDEADADSSGSEKSKDEEIFRTDLANLNYFAPVNLDDFLGEMTDSGGDEDDSDAEIMDSDSDNSDYEEGKSVPNSSSDLNGRDQRSTHRSPRGNNATGEGKRTRSRKMERRRRPPKNVHEPSGEREEKQILIDKDKRERVVKGLGAALGSRDKDEKKNKLLQRIARDIETALFNKYMASRYMTEARSLLNNLKNNKRLLRAVVNATITGKRLVNMTSEEMASEDLRKQREIYLDENLRQLVKIKDSEGEDDFFSFYQKSGITPALIKKMVQSMLDTHRDLLLANKLTKAMIRQKMEKILGSPGCLITYKPEISRCVNQYVGNLKNELQNHSSSKSTANPTNLPNPSSQPTTTRTLLDKNSQGKRSRIPEASGSGSSKRVKKLTPFSRMKSRASSARSTERGTQRGGVQPERGERKTLDLGLDDILGSIDTIYEDVKKEEPLKSSSKSRTPTMSREEHSKQRLPSTTEFSFKEHSPTNHSPRKYSPTQYSPRRYSPREYSPREYSHTAVIPPATSFTYPSYRNPKPNPNTLPMHISRSHPRSWRGGQGRKFQGKMFGNRGFKWKSKGPRLPLNVGQSILSRWSQDNNYYEATVQRVLIPGRRFEICYHNHGNAVEVRDTIDLRVL